MKLELGKLNDQKIQSTGGKTVKMGFSNKANAMLFDMFTDGIYSNPIGSVVREITSNCFDSHIEAGKDTPDNPVIVSHTYDKAAQEHFISFFDKGVGMSPERVENIYGVYFESTKRDGNDQIGGFGIGGKTPMAYTDTFFVITRYNGIEYMYSIYKGEESPEIKLMYENTTTEVNGTEIRVPVKESDITRFVQEIRRQLYYFENIVFTGFDSYANDLNDYKIYKGQNFLYRGNVYGDEVHLCIGKVAYPISYSNMGIDRYDYRVPVALKFEIGDIDVTPNREEVRYTDKTIKMITDKLQEAKDELTAMISKQYDNVRTLDDYYNAKENFGHLTFKDQQNLYVGYWIKKSDVDYANFKYNDLPHIPSSDNLISLFYNVHEYGRSRGYRHSVKYGRSDNMVYQCKGKFERKLLKQSYLNYEFDKHFIILKPYMDLFTDDSRYEKVKVAFGVIKDDGTGQWGSPSYKFTMDEKKAEKLLKQLQKDIAKSVMSTFDSYDDLEVPEEFIEARKQERLSKEILNTTIVLTDIGRWSNKGRVKIKNIIDFKGRIFYGVTDDQQLVQEGYNMFTALFGDKHVDRVYGYRNQFEKGKGIMFVTVARANEKYLKMAPNAYRIELVYPMILRRKMINPNNIKIANDFVKKFEDLEEIYTSTGMELINAVAAKYYKEVKAEKADLEKYENFRYIDFNSTLVTKYFDPNKETKADLLIKTERQLDYLLGVQAKNAKTLKWIEMPYYVSKNDLSEDRYSGLVELLKKVMVF